METRRLQSFVKIVDTGSLTRAATLLHIAQPALSQQLISLENHFKQKLLVRSHQGVAPTEAGKVLYRHAQSILKQIEQAEADVSRASKTLVGKVSVGLAPYSAASTLSLALLRAVRAKYPDILLHINEGFGVSAFSELILTNRLDLAVMHGAGPLRGISFERLFVEEFCVVSPPGLLPPDDDNAVELAALAEIPLLLPTRVNFVRNAVEAAFSSIHCSPRIVAEIESLSTLRDAIEDRAGSTILPWSMATQLVASVPGTVRRIYRPTIEDAVSLCVSEQTPLSPAASAVRDILFDIATAASRRWRDPPAPKPLKARQSPSEPRR